MMNAKAWSAQLANRVVNGLMKAELLARDDCQRAIEVAEAVFDRLCLDDCPPPAASIGRERDAKTGAIREGLGRKDCTKPQPE